MCTDCLITHIKITVWWMSPKHKPHVLLRKKSQSNNFKSAPDSTKKAIACWQLLCFLSLPPVDMRWNHIIRAIERPQWLRKAPAALGLRPLNSDPTDPHCCSKKKRYCFQRNIVHKHNTKGAFYVLCQTLKTNKIGIQLIIKWSNTGRNWNWKGRCLCRLSVVYVRNSRKGQRWGESLSENTKFVETMNFNMLGFGCTQAGVLEGLN